MRGIRKVLVAVNRSMDVARHGINLAKDEGTWVTMIKVIPPYEGDLDLTGVKNLDNVLFSEGQKKADEIKKLATDEGAIVKFRLETGDVHKKIIEVAQEERCDLIVMGTQKRSLFNRIVGANIVEKVISNAPCPVFIV